MTTMGYAAAFPTSTVDRNESPDGTLMPAVGGLTKREYFAAKALQGLCATVDVGFSSDNLAKCAVRIADALIRVLNSQEPVDQKPEAKKD